jgi:rhodanese-related sulfurtransferase
MGEKGRMNKRVWDYVDAAMAVVVTMPVDEALQRHAEGDSIFVDVRDVRELERDGMIPGAFHAPRGMLEFWIDPESPYHKPIFAQPKRFVFYCAGGWRSALAAKVAQEMGLRAVAHIEGGYRAWEEKDGPLAPYRPAPQRRKVAGQR